MMQGQPTRIKSINEFHRLRGLPKPEHPLISTVNYADIKRTADIDEVNWIFDFYQISVKRGIDGKFKYGQQGYDFDFDEGVMFFLAPNQVVSIKIDNHSTAKRSGWKIGRASCREREEMWVV